MIQAFNSTMNNKERVENYNNWLGTTGLFLDESNRIHGTVYLGNNYAKQNDYYGGYQGNYLKRIRNIFPDKQNILHLYAGQAVVDDLQGIKADINPQNNDTVYADARSLSEYFQQEFDLIVADPPYGTDRLREYQNLYNCPAENLNIKKVFREMYKVTKPNAHIVWLDWARPFYRNIEWKETGAILYRGSTGHKDRSISIYERQN
jgi:hypothetical protein|tara:strand:- start:61 stop:675 length:615 start_codon:yes stop_codon:yes gene_type:complete